MILYIEDHKDATRKLLELVNEYSQWSHRIKKLIHRNLLYFYTVTMKNKKEKLKKESHSPFQQKE